MRLRLGTIVAIFSLGFGTFPSLAGPLRESQDVQKLLLPGTTRQKVLDAAARVSVDHGYQLYRMKKSSAVLLTPATMREVDLVGWNDVGAARKRLTFEVYERRNAIRVLGAIDLVAGIGTVGEKTASLARQQPFRNELKQILADLRDSIIKGD